MKKSRFSEEQMRGHEPQRPCWVHQDNEKMSLNGRKAFGFRRC